MATLVAQQAIDSAYLLAISTKDEFPTIDYEGSSYITFNHAPSVFHQNALTKQIKPNSLPVAKQAAIVAPRLSATIPNKIKVEPKLEPKSEPKPDANKGQTRLSTV